MLSVAPTLADELDGLFRPATLYISALYSLIIVILQTIFVKWEPAALFHVSKIRDEAFGRFWLNLNSTADNGASALEPTGSAALVPPLFAQATGVVLEIGPGSGSQMPLLGKNAQITTIYGAEPCVPFHEALRDAAWKAGLRYKILSASAEQQSLVPALAKEGLLGEGAGGGGVFDTIITVRVLCSVSQPQETVDGLYRLLKPGGRWLVVEHVVNPWMEGSGNVVARALQVFYTMIGWSFLVGDCHMDRDIVQLVEKAAKRDGGWKGGALKLSFGWSTLPYVAGCLVKREK